MADLPLFQFDTDRAAVLEPAALIGGWRVPERAVLCFFTEVIEEITADAELLRHQRGEDGGTSFWQIDVDGEPVVVAHPGVGASRAAMVLDLLIAAGARSIVGCGGAGSLVAGQAVGQVVVATGAVRDEGTSYHYLEAAPEVEVHESVVRTLVETLDRHEVPHQAAKVWTTDGLFRETRAKIEDRRRSGCVVVDMELAAFLAVAEFRGVRYGQYLYAGDDVSGEWDHRGWRGQTTVRRALFDLALESVRGL